MKRIAGAQAGRRIGAQIRGRYEMTAFDRN